MVLLLCIDGIVTMYWWLVSQSVLRHVQYVYGIFSTPIYTCRICAHPVQLIQSKALRKYRFFVYNLVEKNLLPTFLSLINFKVLSCLTTISSLCFHITFFLPRTTDVIHPTLSFDYIFYALLINMYFIFVVNIRPGGNVYFYENRKSV